MSGRGLIASRIRNLAVGSFSKERRSLILTSKEKYRNHEENSRNPRRFVYTAVGLSLAGIKLHLEEERRKEDSIKSVDEEKSSSEVYYVNREDKIRHFSPIERLFDYFSSYQIVDDRGIKNLKNGY